VGDPSSEPRPPFVIDEGFVKAVADLHQTLVEVGAACMAALQAEVWRLLAESRREERSDG
jgi:hypothetical protein